METQLKIIRTSFKLLSRIMPELAGKFAFRLFQTTRKKRMSAQEMAFYQNAERFIICHEKEDIIAYRLGNPTGKLVFLVHGWESNAGSMAGIAYSLVQCGFNVITFDLPAHGHSRLRRTNLMECYYAFKAVLDYFKPRNFSVISHSFGSAVSSYTLSKTVYEPEHLVFLTSPDHILDIFEDFSRMVSLGEKAYYHFLKIVQSIVPEPLSQVAVSQMTQDISYKSLLLIHDRFDKIIPFGNSVRFYQQLDNTVLEPFERIGHYRMLWNDDVIYSILNHWQNNAETGNKNVA